MPTTLNKFCFNLFRKAKAGEMNSFYQYLTRQAKFLKELKNASSQELGMFLYGIRIFPPKNEKHWQTIIHTLGQGTENIDKGNIILLSNVLSKKRAGSQSLWNKIGNNAQESLSGLKTHQIVSLCSSFAKIKGYYPSTAGSNSFWKTADKVIRDPSRDLELDEIEQLFQAFSRAQYRNAKFWDFATTLWENKINELTKKQAVTLLWSYSKICLFYSNPAATNKLEAYIASVISKLSNHQLLTVIYSKVQLKSKDLSFLKLIDKNILSQVKVAKLDYVIILAYCLAKLQDHNQDFFETFAIRLINHVNKYDKDLKIRDLANSAWTFARIAQGNQKSSHNQQLWKTLEDQVLKIDDSKIDVKSLTTLLWSFGRMKKGSALLWKKFSKIVLLRVHELNIDHLTIIFNTFSYIKLSDHEFWNPLENKVTEFLQTPGLTHYHLSKLLRSNAKIITIRKISPDLKNLFAQKFHSLLAQEAEFKSSDLFDYIMGFANLGISDDQTWSQLIKLYKANEKDLPNDKMRTLCDQVLKNNPEKAKNPPPKLWIKK